MGAGERREGQRGWQERQREQKEQKEQKESKEQREQLDVFAVGNAIVDTLAFVEDDFLESASLLRGTMMLADAERQSLLLEALQDYSLEIRSGGSAANTIWALTLCGGSGSYTAKVSQDPNGIFYCRELEQQGILYPATALPETHGPTGSCIVLTTPDAERTMSTHLGVSTELSPQDIDTDILRRARYLYCEGYLWSGEQTRSACIAAMEAARQQGVTVAYSFSDPLMAKSFHSDWLPVVKEFCDLIFCNAEEARHFADTEDLGAATELLGKITDVAFVTAGSEGSLACFEGKVQGIPGFPVKAIDTNGAGDVFAGAVLFALSRGCDPLQAARWGNFLAAEIVQIPGARLAKEYGDQFSQILK